MDGGAVVEAEEGERRWIRWMTLRAIEVGIRRWGEMDEDGKAVEDMVM